MDLAVSVRAVLGAVVFSVVVTNSVKQRRGFELSVEPVCL